MDHSDLDDRIREIRAGMEFFRAVDPVNEQEQKELFLSGEVDAPEFEYREHDVSGLRQELGELEDGIEPGPLMELYEDTIDEIGDMLTIIEHRGEDGPVRAASQRIYGRPSEETVELAEDLLRYHDPTATEEKTVSGSELRDRFEAFITGNDLDLAVELKETGNIAVNPASRTIRVPENGSYGEQEAERLILHELCGHGYRALNGSTQDAGILGTGVGDYQKTEEGLNTVMEELSGLSEPGLMAEYAARVLAVDSMLDDDDFRETYELLRDHDLDEDLAWTTTMRAYRSGGLAKDHIYLEGNQEVWDWLDNSEDADGVREKIELLYRGKIGIDDAEEYGDSFRPATYLPHDVLDAAEPRITELLSGNGSLYHDRS